MKQEEILASAIKQAMNNGYSGMSEFVQRTMNWRWFIEENRHYSILFDKEFAKAFWGTDNTVDQFRREPRVCDEMEKHGYYSFDRSSGIVFNGEDWKHHLTQMVLSEDPMKYLKQFIIYNRETITSDDIKKVQSENMEKFIKDGTGAWKGKNAQEWINIIRDI